MSEEIMKKLKEHDDRFNKIDTQMGQMNGQIDLLALKAVEHDDHFAWLKENMATKHDISEIHTTLGDILGYVKKNDHEITFMGERIKRVERDVEKIQHSW